LKVLFCHFDATTLGYGMRLARQIRSAGIHAEVYPDVCKLKKQLEYGNRKAIPYAVIIGDTELASRALTVKNLEKGEQATVSENDLVRYFTE
jgi:histidyl-tRNA synthetase